MMATTDPVAVVRAFYAQAINARDPEAIDRLLTDDFRHNGNARGRPGQALAVKAFLDGFSDLKNEVLITVADGDLVSAHQRWSGTHDGAFMGFAPTGKALVFTSTAILRIRGDQICEAWDVVDLGLLAQLEGRSPPPS